MNLIIDIGNTSIKTAVFDNNEPVNFQSFSHHQTGDILNFIQNHKTSGCIVSSVAEIPRELLNILKKNNTLFFTHNTKIPIKNTYKTPETLGKDRLANAIGAWKLNPGKNNLIIDAGTCLKFDFVNEKGEYHGGSISPGLSMRAKALHQFTDQLPLVDPNEFPQLTGNDTNSSLLSGVCNGMLGEINAMISRYEAEHGTMMITLTGGDSPLFAKALKNSIFADRFLTLRGLNEVLNFNA